MIELGGKAVAQARQEALQQTIGDLKKRGLTPTLAVLLVGDEHGASMYAAFMEKVARKAGIGFVLRHLEGNTGHKEVEEALDALNTDDAVHGILPLMPMPAGVDVEALLGRLDSRKDIDGLTIQNMGLLSAGKGAFVPCTAKACMAILDHYGIALAGKHVVVVGRSAVIGKPVAELALAANATVTICHSHTQDLGAMTRQADILIAAAGKAHMITADMVKPGAVVIDVGINSLDGKTVGDVDYEQVAPVARAITPVPGGVGSVTTTMMLESVCEACYARNVDC